jgi:hypothetical protein
VGEAPEGAQSRLGGRHPALNLLLRKVLTATRSLDV